MSGADAGAAAWTAFLDTLESELQAVGRADQVSGERARKVDPFVAPDLGPLPHEVADRARTLLSQLRDAEDAVRAEVARTQSQLRELRHLDPRGPRPASSVDTRC